MEGRVLVTRVGKGICIHNSQDGTCAYTTKEGFLLIDEQGVQKPIREERLVRDFTNKDGTAVAPQRIVPGRMYNLRRRVEVAI